MNVILDYYKEHVSQLIINIFSVIVFVILIIFNDQLSQAETQTDSLFARSIKATHSAYYWIGLAVGFIMIIILAYNIYKKFVNKELQDFGMVFDFAVKIILIIILFVKFFYNILMYFIILLVLGIAIFLFFSNN